jgi:hypothetical protein
MPVSANMNGFSRPRAGSIPDVGLGVVNRQTDAGPQRIGRKHLAGYISYAAVRNLNYDLLHGSLFPGFR